MNISGVEIDKAVLNSAIEKIIKREKAIWIEQRKIISQVNKILSEYNIDIDSYSDEKKLLLWLINALKEKWDLESNWILQIIHNIYWYDIDDTEIDILKEDENELAKKVPEYSNIINNSPLVLFRMDFSKWIFITDITENFTTITGCPRSDILENNVNILDIIHPDDMDSIKYTIKSNQKEWKTDYELVFRIINKEWELKYIYSKVFIKDIDESSYWFFYDITEKDFYEDTLYQSLMLDKVTWLPNEKKCFKDIETKWVDNLIIFKIRNFEKINTLLWRDKWNKILKMLSDEYNKYIEDNKWLKIELYKTSPTEFTMTFKMPKLLEWKRDYFINRLIKFFQNIDIDYEWVPLFFEYSIWACFWTKEGIFSKAQLALDQSKKRKEDYVIYNEWLWEDITRKYNDFYMWVNRIKNAINWNLEEWHLEVYYQWIRDNNNWETYKNEALIRYYDNETESIVSPFLFLDYVRKAWMLSDITKFVIKDVVDKIDKIEWFESSINFTINDFLNNDSIMFLLRETERKNIDKSKITIEVLEDISIKSDDIIEKIKYLQSKWFKISIDDFWTWNSNFWRLIQLKPNYIKIDGSLIQWVWKNIEKYNVLKSIKTLAEWIWSELVAEFVDSNSDQKIIEELWIEYSQWYLYHKPKKIEY